MSATPDSIAVVCWYCGASTLTPLPAEIEYVADVLALVEAAGMIAKEDAANGRLLVFCDAACDAADRGVTGSYRPRKTPAGCYMGRTGNILSSAYFWEDDDCRVDRTGEPNAN